MDVNPASGTVHPGHHGRDVLPASAAQSRLRRAEQETAATLAPERAGRPDARTAGLAEGDPVAPPEPGEERAPPERVVAAPPSEGSSLLKFDVSSSDVLARFQIDEDTNRVIVSMYQRDTGELIKEYPPREVLDVLAALAGRGLAVDVQG
jgi:hypothetical protein